MKILIVGYQGKMGKMAYQGLTQAGHQCEGCSKEDALSQGLLDKPDVMLDLTSPDVVFNHAMQAITHRIPLVIGTTGLSHQEIETLRAKAQQNRSGVLIVPNFSLGALLMMKFAKEAKSFFSSVEIVEGHHPEKKDMPSGTAKMTAQLMGEDIIIHSRRQRGLLAEQTVYFSDIGERLTIEHQTLSRDSFLPGIKYAINKVIHLNELMIGLETFLNES